VVAGDEDDARAGVAHGVHLVVEAPFELAPLRVAFGRQSGGVQVVAEENDRRALGLALHVAPQRDEDGLTTLLWIACVPDQKERLDDVVLTAA
jgi:hypothetical protein